MTQWAAVTTQSWCTRTAPHQWPISPTIGFFSSRETFKEWYWIIIWRSRTFLGTCLYFQPDIGRSFVTSRTKNSKNVQKIRKCCWEFIECNINWKQRVAGICYVVLSGVDDNVKCGCWRLNQIDLNYFICTILRQFCGKLWRKLPTINFRADGDEN